MQCLERVHFYLTAPNIDSSKQGYKRCHSQSSYSSGLLSAFLQKGACPSRATRTSVLYQARFVKQHCRIASQTLAGKVCLPWRVGAAGVSGSLARTVGET